MPDPPTNSASPILEWDPNGPDPASPDPNSPTFARDFKSFVRKILLVSPYFPRFYADILIDRAPNSNAARILRKNYAKILEKVNMAVAQQKSSRTCTHIKVTGVRCDSPSLRGEQFCYFHQRMMRGVRTPPQARLHPIALIEDETSIQAALMEVINALMRNTIDLKRANLILRALHIAVKNVRYAKFSIHSREMVKEVPDYAMPAEDHVGTAAPGGPGRAAAVPDARVPAARVNAARVPAARVNDELSIHEDSIAPEPLPPKRRPDPACDGKTHQQLLDEYFGRTPEPPSAAPPATPTAEILPNGTAHVAADTFVRPAAPAADLNLSRKKPPVNAKLPVAPKERKNAAHRASAG
jgi:hypothetical protein